MFSWRWPIFTEVNQIITVLCVFSEIAKLECLQPEREGGLRAEKRKCPSTETILLIDTYICRLEICLNFTNNWQIGIGKSKYKWTNNARRPRDRQSDRQIYTWIDKHRDEAWKATDKNAERNKRKTRWNSTLANPGCTIVNKQMNKPADIRT